MSVVNIIAAAPPLFRGGLPFTEGGREIHNARKKLMRAKQRKKNTREISSCPNHVKYSIALGS